MPRPRSVPPISPTQAKYVIDRLLEDRRIGASDILRYVADMEREIRDLETRLDALRAAAGAEVRAQQPTVKRPSSEQGRSGRRTTRRGDPLAGSYMGYMRQVPAARKAKYKRIRAEHGFAVAISALRADLGR